MRGWVPSKVDAEEVARLRAEDGGIVLRMDPWALLVNALLGLLTGAIAGGVIGEWRARAAEGRAEKFGRAAEERADAKDRARLRRDKWLHAIEETERDLAGAVEFYIAKATGNIAAMRTIRHGPQDFPKAMVHLVGDGATLRLLATLHAELGGRPTGSGLSDHDMARLSAAHAMAMNRLGQQAERVMDGQEPFWPSAGVIRELIDIAGDQYGIPPEYRPIIKDD